MEKCRNRVLLVGWDAADWKIIDPLLARGELPHLAHLIAGGTKGSLSSLYPSLSPMLWTSIATGKRPHKHGIMGFIEPAPDGMGIRPVTNLSRKTKAVWNILNQCGKRSLVIGWWPSHPAEPISGAMVSEQFRLGYSEGRNKPLNPGTVFPKTWSRELADLRAHPSEITPEILRLFVPEFQHINQDQDTSLHDLAGFIADTMSIHAAVTELLVREAWDFAAVYYNVIDHFSHRFMSHHSGPSGSCAAGLEQVVENAYRYHDAMLGQLLALVGDDCRIMLISDHGFCFGHLLPAYIPAQMNGPAVEHRHIGIFCLSGPGCRRGNTVHGTSILDVAPTILQLFGLPVGQDMDGRPVLGSLDDQSVPEPIPSWDQVPGNTGEHAQGHLYQGTASVETMRQLVALGYVAPLGEDKKQDIERCLLEWDYNVAAAELDRGCPDLSARILEGLIIRDDGDARFYEMLANCLLLVGDLIGCERLLDRFDASCATHASRAAEELRERRARCSDAKLMAGSQDNAWSELRLRQYFEERAHAFEEDRALLHCRLASRRSSSPEQKETVRVSLRALEQRLGVKGEPALLMAECWAVLGDFECALNLLHTLQDQDPQDWQALALEASIHYERGRYLEAATCAVKSLCFVYHQPFLHWMLGIMLSKLNEMSGAEEELRLAVSQMPGLPYSREEETSFHALNILEMSSNTNVAANVPSPNGSLEDSRSSDHRVRYAAFERIRSSETDREQTVIVVTGLPRSGTSMMMQMLVAAGITPYTDHQRKADEDNPRGYFEHEQATRLHHDVSWIPSARGKAVKIVAQLLPFLPLHEEYRVVFMHRCLEEVVASQNAMLERLRRAGGNLEPEQMVRVYFQQVQRVQTWLQIQQGIDVLAVQFENTLIDPAGTAMRLANFLGAPFDVKAATDAVAPFLRRQQQGTTNRN
jgi:predicted AlkP superfamily phosphohydrolase/phosphomutase/tetratricopeptide (TPR) repeat protein